MHTLAVRTVVKILGIFKNVFELGHRCIFMHILAVITIFKLNLGKSTSQGKLSGYRKPSGVLT